MSEIRLPAERKYEAELKALAASDKAVKPPGWALSPRAVETYVLGSDKPVGGEAITPKYVGDRSIVQVAIATLASDRALMPTSVNRPTVYAPHAHHNGVDPRPLADWPLERPAFRRGYSPAHADAFV